MSAKRAVLIVLVMTFAAAGLIATAYPAPRSTNPRKLLEQVAAAYKHARTYQEEGTFVYEQTMPGLQMRMEMRYKIAYRAPNFLLYDRGPGFAATKVVCDGKTAYVAVPMFQRVVKAPAPPDARVLLTRDALRSPFMFAPASADSATFMSGTFDMSKVTSVRAGLVRPSRWLRSLRRPPGTVVVTVETGRAVATVLWIDRRTHMLRQVACDFSSDGVKRAVGEMGAGGESAVQMMGDLFTGMTMRTLLTVRKAVIDKPIPDRTFAYTPPKGTTVTEVKSVAELQAALRSGGAGGDTGDEGGEGEGPQKSLAGKAPVDFTAQDLDGKPVALSSFKGKPVVVDFCATWCPPCRAELPVLEEQYARLKDQGLEVIAVFTDDNLADVKKFLEKNKLSFTVLWLDPASDEGKRVDTEYGITGIPRTLYIGADWLVKTDNVGFSGKEEILKSLASLGMKTE
jgi:peroxiredoxin/outer membrane lipoprotein-sorting protein